MHARRGRGRVFYKAAPAEIAYIEKIAGHALPTRFSQELGLHAYVGALDIARFFQDHPDRAADADSREKLILDLAATRSAGWVIAALTQQPAYQGHIPLARGHVNMMTEMTVKIYRHNEGIGLPVGDGHPIFPVFQ